MKLFGKGLWRSGGGVTQYIVKNHNIVLELARRGIVSSICSKNDEGSTLKYLNSKGILEYFVFPSISWEPKGPRLVALIKAIGLRPASCMFIDDNPSNLGEAVAFLPDIQIERETFIPRILTDPRFKGKEDSSLSRLKQYQLLQARKSDEVRAGGDNIAFLRSCDIRVHLDYDVSEHLDRAIELVNRTNQLNFTKWRLPENIELAREKLTGHLKAYHNSAALVRVTDRYGDYGFVGFYMMRPSATSAGWLYHYCFSCRTLGMMVEHWLYDYLGRPEIKIVGEVLSNLDENVCVDWIRLANSDSTDAAMPMLAEEIRIHGACESAAVAHYIGAHTRSVKVSGSFRANDWNFTMNGAALLLSACEREGPEFKAEAERLMAPYELLVSSYFRNASPGTVFIFSGSLDGNGGSWYRNTKHGWELRAIPDGVPGLRLFGDTDEELSAKILARSELGKEATRIVDVALYLRANYTPVPPPSDAQLESYTKAMLEKVPPGCKIIFLLDSEKARDQTGMLRSVPSRVRYRRVLESVIGQCAFAALVSFDSVIASDEEIQTGVNHYERMVYYRLSNLVVEAIRTIHEKQPD